MCSLYSARFADFMRLELRDSDSPHRPNCDFFVIRCTPAHVQSANSDKDRDSDATWAELLIVWGGGAQAFSLACTHMNTVYKSLPQSPSRSVTGRSSRPLG